MYTDTEVQIAELYVGILGRAPDAPGLQYWVNNIENGSLSYESLRASFATPAQTEYWDVYGGLTNTQLVDRIYTNYLERSPDSAGMAYWVSELNSGRISPDHMINAIINAVKDKANSDPQRVTDELVLTNKVEAALYFTKKSAPITNINAGFITQAKGVVSGVNNDPSTVTQAKSLADKYMEIVPVPQLDLQTLRGNIGTFNHAVAYGDFNGDGFEDVFIAPGTPYVTYKTPVELYINDGNGQYSLDNSFVENPQNGGIHPRKAVAADFNGDGRDDVIIADHGYDAVPFPGAAPILLLSSDAGLKKADGLEGIVGFHHSVAVGDIDRDGDNDAFFTDNMSRSFFLINDGQGNMTYNADIAPSDLQHKNYFTSELIDFDQDGYLDLLVGGHEFEGAETAIYWGSAAAGFRNTLKTTISEGPSGHQIVVDIDAGDINGDGQNDLILNRVGSPPDKGFYGANGTYIQILTGNGRSLTDVTEGSIDMAPLYANYPNLNWIDWLHMQDQNGDGSLDLVAADINGYSDHIYFQNDGAGHFTLV